MEFDEPAPLSQQKTIIYVLRAKHTALYRANTIILRPTCNAFTLNKKCSPLNTSDSFLVTGPDIISWSNLQQRGGTRTLLFVVCAVSQSFIYSLVTEKMSALLVLLLTTSLSTVESHHKSFKSFFVTIQNELAFTGSFFCGTFQIGKMRIVRESTSYGRFQNTLGNQHRCSIRLSASNAFV